MSRVAALERQIINPWSWQDRFGFVQANAVTSAGRTIYCSGQTSMDADGNPIHEGDMRAQLSQALDNLEALLRASDSELSDVVRLNYYTTDVDGFFAAMDVVVARPEGGRLPSCDDASRSFPPGASAASRGARGNGRRSRGHVKHGFSGPNPAR